MIVGILILLGIVAIFFIVVYFSFRRDTPDFEQSKNFDISKVDYVKYGRMPGSFGRYGYDITNPIVTDDLYKYLGKVVYRNGNNIEDASPICGYKISLFKNHVFHTAVKVEGESSPILLYFIKGKTNSSFYPRNFFSGFIYDLSEKGISLQLRYNTKERLLFDAEENEGGTYKIEKVIRLKDSYIGKNWKEYAKNYKPMKPSRAIPPDVYASMLQTNKMLAERARMRKS